VLLWLARGLYPDLKRNSKGVITGILLGPVLVAAWIAIDHFTPHFKILGGRSSFDPFTTIADQRLCWMFIVIRVFGITAIAPLIEELFYRAFLLRLVTRPDNFIEVPLGQYDLTAFIAVVVIMASAHPEYLAAAVFSAVMNILLFRTKNLWATIAAHASTNFFLAVYVLYFHAWKYW
jgi:CAAX prenyl protease-like protein